MVHILKNLGSIFYQKESWFIFIYFGSRNRVFNKYSVLQETLEITELTKNVTAGKIFVTAFLDFKTYKKFAEELAWDTEVWIAEMPEHMIHFNGDKFVEPRWRSKVGLWLSWPFRLVKKWKELSSRK